MARGALVPAQRQGLRAAPRTARLDGDDCNAAAATRSALLAAVDELLKSQDSAFFREPVDTLYVPDYLDVVARPMDLSTVRTDVTGHRVTTVAQLADAFDLIVANATSYNPPGHAVHEAARVFARRAAVAVDAARGRVLAKPYLPGCSKARIRCARCRKARALPPGRTASRSTTCADLGMTCKRRECSTLVIGCSCTKYPTAPRAVVRTQGYHTKSTQVHTKYFCTARAAAQGYRPDAALRETHESRIENACRTGEPYLGAMWVFAREDCALCASGADPGSILLCDGEGCTVEAHYYCAGLDAVPRGQWFCSKKCQASVPGESGTAPEEYSARTPRSRRGTAHPSGTIRRCDPRATSPAHRPGDRIAPPPARCRNTSPRHAASARLPGTIQIGRRSLP